MEDQKSLKAGASVGELANSVHDVVNHFLSNSVMTAGIVVGSIFISSKDLVGVIQVLVGLRIERERGKRRMSHRARVSNSRNECLLKIKNTYT